MAAPIITDVPAENGLPCSLRTFYGSTVLVGRIILNARNEDLLFDYYQDKYIGVDRATAWHVIYDENLRRTVSILALIRSPTTVSIAPKHFPNFDDLIYLIV